MTSKVNKKGFTIIEVVLVLAIAGLIFLMVFLAFPNLQRSQNDTRRRNDYSELYSTITSYVSNLNGRIPSPDNGNTPNSLSPKTYINKTGENPDGVEYQIVIKHAKDDASAVTPGVENDGEKDKVFVVFYATCSEKNNVKKSNNKKDFVVIGKLEASQVPYCQSNSTKVEE